MALALSIQELSIIIAAKNHNPSLLTSDFLKYSGIIPSDWELAQPPLLDSKVAQVAFTNGINFVAQPNIITFSESLIIERKQIPMKQEQNEKNGSREDLRIPDIVHKYVKTLPNADYNAVVINPKTFLTFSNRDDQNAARSYIVTTLLSPGVWHDVGQEIPKVEVSIVYTLGQRQLHLSIEEARLELYDQPLQPAVLFSGNFAYEIAGGTKSERLQHLYQLIDNCQIDLETYREIIKNKFLEKEATSPALTP